MEITLEQAFQNVVLMYKNFGKLLPDEHQAMQMSLEKIKEALFPPKPDKE